jgi:hypothetical protein
MRPEDMMIFEGCAALVAAALLLLDAGYSISTGEFRYAGRMRFNKSVSRQECPKLFWSHVIAYLCVAGVAIALALTFLDGHPI